MTPKTEEKILRFWQKEKIFEKSLRKTQKRKRFVFYDGPITTNARPGIHMVLARVFKDIIPRFKTMQGFHVARKNGWDTHGLPVELEVEKLLGFKSKKDIEKYGIAKFNKACKKNVQKYISIFKKATERIAYWVDMEDPYITYDNNYIESLWWIIKKAWERGLLYQDFRITPYCPRCGTGLSSHEVAQGYKKIKEPAVYIKFKLKKEKNTYLLAWTTTPWTLPGNIAIAINPELNYVKIKHDSQYLIVVEQRAFLVPGEIIKKFKGKELLGLEYEPLYLSKNLDKKAYFVISGNFVSFEEGTGLVHIASFGEDDLRVSKENDLPILLNVDEQGKFLPEVEKFKGMFVKQADPLIIEDLEKRKILFKQETYEHDYPFCWRCKSPLIYYPRQSWFIGITKVKKDLIANSQKISWFPGHLKKGRFGEWLKGIRDWNLSRDRYWGTPLPVWECKSCGNREVIGSKKDIRKQKFSTNTFHIMRHGYSLSNQKGIVSCWPEKFKSTLTKKGIEDAKRTAKKLKNIDIIYSSDVLRTRQTAEIVANKKIPLKFDKRLREINVGIFNGKPVEEIGRFYDPLKKLNPLDYHIQRYRVTPPKGENYVDVEKRLYSFIKDVSKKHQNQNILIVSHQRTLSLLEKVVSGFDLKDFVKIVMAKKEIKTAETRKLNVSLFPYGEKMEMDFHRPYIDKVEFACSSCGHFMNRVPEVIDCWFDSGSMPFAQYHYPFENKEYIDKKIQFPAEYISEAIDQTRGWFYTLLAISTLLGLGASYKNVVCLGHLLDEKGEKMSKSKGNIVDPWKIINEQGVDSLRWFFFVVNQPGDSKRYDVKELRARWQRTGITFWNCWQFLKSSLSGKIDPFLINKPVKINNILDQWIVSLSNKNMSKVTEKLENYDITGAAREIESLIDNLSNWYLRRSRQRIRDGQGLDIFYSILFNINLLLAPFVPFLTENMFQGLSKFSSIKLPQSVHLMDWPKFNPRNFNDLTEKKMKKALDLVNLSLAERIKLGIKVRQPLQKLIVKSKSKLDKEILSLIAEEINVKEIVFNDKIKSEVELDAKISQSLREEGMRREIVRFIQGLRKKAGLKPKDRIIAYYSCSKEMEDILEKIKKDILKETKAKDFSLDDKMAVDKQGEFTIDNQKLILGIKNVSF